MRISLNSIPLKYLFTKESLHPRVYRPISHKERELNVNKQKYHHLFCARRTSWSAREDGDDEENEEEEKIEIAPSKMSRGEQNETEDGRASAWVLDHPGGR